MNIKDLDSAGLPSASVVRMKLFTLDNKLVIRKAGVLAKQDRTSLFASLHKLLRLKA